jgi:hypothetical protein
MATQQQQQPTRGRGRPRADVKHKPCAFTFTIFAEYLAELEKKGISPTKAKMLAREAATTALKNIISQQQISI